MTRQRPTQVSGKASARRDLEESTGYCVVDGPSRFGEHWRRVMKTGQGPSMVGS